MASRYRSDILGIWSCDLCISPPYRRPEILEKFDTTYKGMRSAFSDKKINRGKVDEEDRSGNGSSTE
jgi:hypothetical protein